MRHTLPSFWYDPTAPVPWFYKILAVLYAFGRWAHIHLTHPANSPMPTLCVGNITIGGAGKTPVVRALRILLKEFDSVVLTRGYKGRAQGPLFVCSTHSADYIGDESCLHHRDGPVIVSKNRLAGILFAKQKGFSLAFMDDGLQNRSVTATVNLLVIDGNIGFGNERLLPAGPLRELYASAIDRADAVLLIGDDKTSVRQKIPENKPVFTAHPVYDVSMIDRDVPYIAFCGLARPEKFYTALSSLGISILETINFPDHHSYSSGDLDHLLNRTKQIKARLITTEKDAVKIPDPFCNDIKVLPMKIVFNEPEQITSFLKKALSNKKT